MAENSNPNKLTGDLLRNIDIGHMLELRERIVAVESERDELREAIRLTIMENLGLADGDVCTLKRLKDAIGFDLPDDFSTE